ncbi:arabinofuranosyltransferase AftA domain protein [Mycobacterium xenopi 4042]|uniref:Arabinofuranosyltransferase AftA domain protein n=1 Tax=Mycobacterium xenopi 4042 TaxID=1299334 RepID=X7ZIF3_MYCXE|nr:arabinofuranosyltransferase AftA domain protein [Mycobacterium xenopi 4042]
MVIAAAIAAVVAVVSLKAIGGVNWPAYPSSNQLHALTTVGQVGCIVGLVATGWLWRRGQRALRVLAGWRRWCSCPRFPLSRWPCRWAPPSSTCSGSRWTSSSAPSI